jgi:hypothetical protein
MKESLFNLALALCAILAWGMTENANAIVNNLPEPSSMLLVGAGIAGVAILRKRFKK